MPDLPTLTRTLVDAVDGVCAADPAALADGETVVLLHRQIERLTAAATRATDRFNAGGAWAASGARTAAAWVAVEAGLPLAAAQRLVRLGQKIRQMPLVEQAWLEGRLHGAQVALLGSARDAAEDAFQRDEAMLVGQAQRLRHERFAAVIAYWRQLNDPDGSEDQARDLDKARRAHLSPGLHGTRILDAVFTPIGGAVFENALRRIERSLFDRDWAKAKERLGRDPLLSELHRTPAQRRHDALVEMARRSAATPPGARLPEPLLTVLVGYETLAGRICELANGTPVTPGSLVPLLDEAWIERVVFDGPDRIKNVGVRRRLFRGATRRAVEIRDRECYHAYCDVRFERCEIDHVEPYGKRGLTVDRNGRCACRYHNNHRPDGDGGSAGRPAEPPG